MEVVVVGSMTIDVTSYLPSSIPNFGHSINVDKFGIDFGGNGANQATMPRLLGAQVAFIGKLGNDIFGKMYRDHMVELGIDVTSLGMSDTAKTGASQVMVHQESGQYAAVGYLGANLQVSLDDIKKAELVIASAKCLIVSLETPFDATLEALRIARQGNATTIFNPSPPSYIVRLLASATEYESYLRLADVICPNEYEAAALTGEQIPADGHDEPAFLACVTRMVERLHRETCRVGNQKAIVLVTLGERGVAFWNSDNGQVDIVETKRVNAVDSTGAGDCFVGALSYFIVRHAALPICEKIRRAALIATMSVTKCGTQSSYPKREELPVELFT